MGTEPQAVTNGAALAAVEREREAWEALLAEVGEARMTEPGTVGDWSFKDLVAHLFAWEEREMGRFEAALAGRPDPAPPWPADLAGDDPINEWIRADNAARPLAEVVGTSRDVFARLAAVARSLPESELNDPGRFPWANGIALGPSLVDGRYFEHLHGEHEADVRRWLGADA